MTLVKDSVVVSAIRRALLWLWAEVRSSVLGRVISWLWDQGRHSRFVTFLRREGHMDRLWEASFSFRVLNGVLNAPGTFFRFLRRKTGGRLEGGILRLLSDHYAVVLGLFFAVMLLVEHTHWNNLYAVIAAFVLLFVLYAVHAMRQDRPIRVGAAGPFLLLYLILVVYAFLNSASRSDSLRFLLFHLCAVVLIYLLVSGLRQERELRRFVYVLLGTVTLLGLYAIYQRITGVEVDDLLMDLTMDLNRGIPGRVYATFENPNNFAEILVMTIPLYLAVLLSRKSGREKCLVLLCMIPPLVAIGMTYSRSGWIGLVIALLVFVALKDWRILPLILVLGAILVPLLPQSILNRILTLGVLGEDSSTNTRFLIYQEFWPLLRDRWLTGVGLGSDVVLKVLSEDYVPVHSFLHYAHSHNNYVQILAEMGALGLLSYLAFALNSLKKGVRTVCARRAPRETENYTAALVSSLVGVMVMGIVEYTWFYPRVMFLFFAVLGLIAACAAVEKDAPEPISESR